MNALTAFGAILLTTAAASVAHEATHYAVAWALGRAPRFRWREWAVYWDGYEPPRAGAYAIALAPVAVGVVVGAVALAARVTPVWAVPAWVLYTLWGIPNDTRPLRAGADGMRDV